MADPKNPYIVIEKINLERIDEFQDALLESGKEWFAAGMIPKPDLSDTELAYMVKSFLQLWDQDNTYMFYVRDATANQMVGVTFLNHVNRIHQMANLGYVVRTSRTGEGIATQAARLVAQYGFEKLGLQRIEVVVHPGNTPSLKVAGKLGAVREGLLRNRLLLHGSPCPAYMHSLVPADLELQLQ